MLNEAKATVGTPSKTKPKEDLTWNCGWWDFYPLSEYPRRPVEWSNSSIIFTGHALQPLILARHFSSSKQFTMLSPAPLMSNPNNYEPPTIITCSPDNRWLFSFFPGRGQDGLCCLWQRGMELDNWSVKEWWTFASGAGVVAASWLGGPREWAIDPSTGVPTRLPSRGPPTPVSSPTLLFVTQDHRLVVCYLRFYVPTIKMFSCSLRQPSVASERQPDNSQNALDEVGSVKICINAAIGTSFGESSIFIAMRSQVFPLPSSSPPDPFPLDLSLSLDIEPEQTETYSTSQEDLSEDSTIEIAEAHLLFDGMVMGVGSRIHPPIENAPGRLRGLTFVCKPPTSESPTSTLNLIATFIDFGDYVSLPSSIIKCYPFSKLKSSAGEQVSWTIHPEVKRDFESGILAHVAQSQPVSGERGLYVSIYDTSGTQPRQTSKPTEVAVGTLKVLKIPDLSDDETWEGSPILSPVHRIGREVPVGAVVSPGGNLLCTIFPSPWSSQMAVQKLPRRKVDATETSIPPLALSFVAARLSNRSSDDLTHALSQPSMPLNEVSEVLYHVFVLLDRHTPGDFASQLGLTIESYRSRALQTSSSGEKGRVNANWRTAHDMVSLVACNAIFNDCRDEEEYQTDLIWQLIDLSSWIMCLLEKLVKECILSSDFTDPQSSRDGSNPDSPNKPSRILTSPVFLHLVHPTALQNLRTSLGHIKQFQAYLAKLTPRTENAQLSRDILLDLVECSGIDIQGLDAILEKLSKSVQEFSAMASCQPLPSMQIPLKETVNLMSKTPALDKARLFVKSFEMVDGQPHMPFDRLQKDKNKDVVSKGLLLHRSQGMNCLRCGGQTEYGKDLMSPRLIVLWEKSWARRCVCGGSWTR
ncbi:hypothetical protein BDP27DRAFT_1315692, partial [Rhodocollybia butyracea]